MNYGEIFEKAWKIIWRHKVLWIFGILASCSTRSGGGGGGGQGFQYNFGRQDMQGIPYQNLPPGMQQWFFNLERAIESGAIWAYIAGIIGVLIIVGLLLWLLFLVLGTFGRIGLIRGTWIADESTERFTFGSLWRSSAHYFWRVFLYLIVFAILSFILGVILAIPIILFTVCTLCLGLLVVIAVSWFISTWFELSLIAIVGEDLGVIDGIKRAWEVITKHLGPVVVVALILFIGAGLVGLLIGLPFLLVVIPILVGVGAQARGGVTTGLIAAGVLFLLYLPVAIFLYGVLQSYVTATWTLLYRRLTGRSGQALPLPAQPTEPGAAQVFETPAGEQ